MAISIPPTPYPEGTKFLKHRKTGLVFNATPSRLEYPSPDLVPCNGFEDEEPVRTGPGAVIAVETIKKVNAKLFGKANNPVAAQPKTDKVEETEDEIFARERHAKMLQIIEAISLLDPSNADHYTGSGKPDSRVLSDMVGFTVPAAMRDEAFETFKAQHPANAGQ